jgi:UPF0755 protein
MRKKLKILFLVLTVVLVGVGLWGYQKYKDFFLPNVPPSLSSDIILIYGGADLDDVVHTLDTANILLDTTSFRQVAARMNYLDDKVKPGRYKIQPSWNNVDLVRLLRSGRQEPVKVIINMGRLLEDVAGKTAQFLEPDSSAFMALFSNQQYLDSIGYSSETLMSLFIPNTYEFFWNTDCRGFVERMMKEHKAFWSKNNRLEKANALGLTPEEVYTLASIVERESNKAVERPTIAGVYLNRLKIGMILQADPTLVFATRDFTATRVLNYHKEIESPYNTYKYAGLPPGPISMASISSIDAVLNFENHDYLYFCAKPDASGFHSFAKTLAQHNRNAARYRASLRN